MPSPRSSLGTTVGVRLLQRLTNAFVDGLAHRQPGKASAVSRRLVTTDGHQRAKGSGFTGPKSLRSLLHVALEEAVPEASPHSFRIRVEADGWVSLDHGSLDEDTLAFAEEIVNEVLLSPHVYGANGRAEAELGDPTIPKLVSHLEDEFELDELRFTFDPVGRVRLFHEDLDRPTLRELEGQLYDMRTLLGTRVA